MIARFYVDVFPGMRERMLIPVNCTMSSPNDRCEGSRRFFFEVDFPIDEYTRLDPVKANEGEQGDG